MFRILDLPKFPFPNKIPSKGREEAGKDTERRKDRIKSTQILLEVKARDIMLKAGYLSSPFVDGCLKGCLRQPAVLSTLSSFNPPVLIDSHSFTQIKKSRLSEYPSNR
jgi:hypothetical protein